MRALILSPALMWPLHSGAKIRMFHVIKHLSRQFDITLLSLAEDSDARALGPIAEWCEDVRIVPGGLRRNRAVLRSALSLSPYQVVKFWTPQFQEELDTMLDQERFHVIWVNSISMMVYLRPCLTASSVVALDEYSANELEWMRYAKEGPILRRLFAIWNLLKGQRFQRRVLQYVDVFVSVSEEEADFMQQRVPASAKVWIVPNGVDGTYFQSKSLGMKPGNVILFCGSMDITMNVDAVCYFASAIFPAIRRVVSDAEFWIVGRKPSKKVHQLATFDGVWATGTVEDVRPFYERAKVSVAPFRFGAGTKLKVLESMAMGVPIVSTSTGCQGIKVQSGKEVWVADDARAFAKAVTQLLLDEQSGLEMCEAARRLIEERYDWGSILENVGDRLIQEVFHKRGTVTSNTHTS
jgi:sugar transferase (PEP-CTERM/EpsH1 system associated)